MFKNLAVLVAGLFFAQAVSAATPAKMTIAAGNNQTTISGTAVPGVVCVLISDADNKPVGGVSVTWGSITGGGTLVGATQLTLVNGVATLGNWTLGPGLNSITCTSDGLNSVVFTANGIAAEGNLNAVLQWDNTLLHAVAVAKVGPTISARAMGVVHSGIFDAWAAYDATAVGTRLGGTLRRPIAERTDANKTAALSFAAYRILLDLFPTQQATFDAQMSALALDPQDMSTDTATPAGIGNAVAAAIILFRHNDGSNQTGTLNPGAYTDYTSYTPANTPAMISDPNRWQPLTIAGIDQIFLTPQWGVDASFAIGLPEGKLRKRIAPRIKPALFPTRAYKKQSDDVVTLSATLTDEPRRWRRTRGRCRRIVHAAGTLDVLRTIRLAARQTHARRRRQNVFRASAMRCSTSALKSGISNESTIRCGRSRQSAICTMTKSSMPGAVPDWEQRRSMARHFNRTSSRRRSRNTSPGTAVSARPGAQVLASFTKRTRFGLSVTLQPGSSPIEPGIVPAKAITLFWLKFVDAANQAGMSRRYGGIHFKDGDLQGRVLGKKIGTIVWQKSKDISAEN